MSHNTLDHFDMESDLKPLEILLIERVPDELSAGDEKKLDFGIVNIFQLEGFFAGLLTMPEFIRPSEWLAVIWGDFPPLFEDTQDAEEQMARLMRFYNNVNHRLQEGAFFPLWSPEVEDPAWEELVEAVQQGGDILPETLLPVAMWFQGYLMAFARFSPTVMALLESLEEKMTQEAEGEQLPEDEAVLVDRVMYPMVYAQVLMQQVVDPNPGAFKGLEQYKLAEQAMEMLEELPNLLFDVLEPERMQPRAASPGLQQPFQHDQPKVGRNDPCPCGSGKKYKHCCLQ